MEYNNYNELLYDALKNLNYAIITDECGKIRFISDNYKKLLNIKDYKYMGKYILDIISDSKIPRVIKSKVEEIGELYTLSNGKTVVCNRVPILQDGEFRGVISSAIFYNLKDIAILNKEIEDLEKENLKYKKKVLELSKKTQYTIDEIIGDSKPITSIKDIIEEFAKFNLTFLITGETGTGKEVFANAIHQLSDRKDEEFVKVNCAAIPKELLESELFGYEPGSFSGASKQGKMGKFELANKGTLLLDEIGDMSLDLQSKLLRVLQENEVERIGGLKPISLDVRVICSTNQDIKKQVEEGLFRKDLYYRINVVEINIPPLRKRYEDLKSLANYFINNINLSYGLNITGINEDVFLLFEEHDWEGNVRELKHTLERACVTAKIGTLKLEHFTFFLSRIYKENKINNDLIEDNSLNIVVEELEKEKIIKALIKTKGNKSSAAKLLKIDRSSLYNKLKKYDIYI